MTVFILPEIVIIISFRPKSNFQDQEAAKDVRTSGTSASLRWRIHCIDPGSRPGDYHAGWQNSSSLRAAQGCCIVPQSVNLRTGVLELDCILETWA